MVDAADSKSAIRKDVLVRFQSWAQNIELPQWQELFYFCLFRQTFARMCWFPARLSRSGGPARQVVQAGLPDKSLRRGFQSWAQNIELPQRQELFYLSQLFDYIYQYNQTIMKSTYFFRLLLSSILFFVSCTDNKNAALIKGKWTGVEWLVDGSASSYNAPGTVFEFEDKGKYSFTYNGAVETGSYKVENDMLFTTPEKQTEMMVKIAKLTTDTLVFEMNRSGAAEKLTLVRK